MKLPKTQLFTGLRPTGDLTIANYLGAIKPMVDLQSKRNHITMFVADIHALTDQEPKQVAAYRYEIARDYIALGLNPDKATIFVQSAIRDEVLELSAYLSRHMTLAEIMRVPTLKDKLKDPEHPEHASVLLASYPIIMAADILLQGAETVPVGDDQIAHLEVCRLLARRFNSRYEKVFYEPKPLQVKSLRLMSLNGRGKMSKSNPSGAILLSESPQSAASKVLKAETAAEGEMNDVLSSHFLLAEALCDSDAQRSQVEKFKREHKAGEKVMGEFKQLLASQVKDFLTAYQKNKASVSTKSVKDSIEKGNKQAQQNARAYITAVRSSLGF